MRPVAAPCEISARQTPTRAGSWVFIRSPRTSGVSSREPTYRTLRLLSANAAGMTGFLLAAAVGQEFAGALVAGVLVGAIGYIASSALVEFAAA